MLRSRAKLFVLKCYVFGCAFLCSLLIAFLGTSYPSECLRSPYSSNMVVREPSQTFTVINLTNMSFSLRSNTCKSTSSIDYVILVNSALENKEYRDIIRASWGRPRMPGVVTRLVFMLGATENTTLQEEIIAESVEQGDLVQGTFLDTYRNLTYKSVTGHVWVSQFCENAKYVLKTDDDIYIDMYGTHTVLERLMRSRQNQRRYREGKLMVGVANHVYTSIIRNEEDEWNKWFVSYDEWPRDEAKFPGDSPEHFPCYIVGWFLITNPATSRRIAKASQNIPYLYLEDVWVTGLLREKMGIQFVDLYGLRADTNDQLLVTKAIQTSHTWVKTFITSISFPRVPEEFRLCHELEREARRCYQEGCRSNVYTPDTHLSKLDLERERAVLGLRRDEWSNITLAEEFYTCAITPEYSYDYCKMNYFDNLNEILSV